MFREKGDELGSRHTWFQILVLTSAGHVTLQKSFSTLGSQISP